MPRPRGRLRRGTDVAPLPRMRPRGNPGRRHRRRPKGRRLKSGQRLPCDPAFKLPFCPSLFFGLFFLGRRLPFRNVMPHGVFLTRTARTSEMTDSKDSLMGITVARPQPWSTPENQQNVLFFFFTDFLGGEALVNHYFLRFVSRIKSKSHFGRRQVLARPSSRCFLLARGPTARAPSSLTASPSKFSFSDREKLGR